MGVEEGEKERERASERERERAREEGNRGRMEGGRVGGRERESWIGAQGWTREKVCGREGSLPSGYFKRERRLVDESAASDDAKCLL